MENHVHSTNTGLVLTFFFVFLFVCLRIGERRGGRGLQPIQRAFGPRGLRRVPRAPQHGLPLAAPIPPRRQPAQLATVTISISRIVCSSHGCCVYQWICSLCNCMHTSSTRTSSRSSDRASTPACPAGNGDDLYLSNRMLGASHGCCIYHSICSLCNR